ncbi:MAG: hypothetical protein R3335_13925, partial [Anaerolineales bacterium]|nr:hypothetical protein [Anaerolineales bacterium]
KALFPLFTISLLVGCYRYWRARGVGFLLAILGAILLFTVPLIFNHATTGFANLPFTTYLVLGTLWSIEGLYEYRPRALMMGGLLLAFAGWTRSEGLGFSIVIIAALILARWISARKLLPPLYWLIPLLLIPGLWSILGSQYLSGDEIGLVLRHFIDEALAGNIDLANLGIIFGYAWNQVLSPNIWGILFFICAILLLLGIRYLGPRSYPENFTLLLASLAALAVPIGMMFVASATKVPLEGWLAVSMDRALFPAVFLGTVLSVLLGSLFLAGRREAGSA